MVGPQLPLAAGMPWHANLERPTARVKCELIAPYYWEKFTNYMSVKDCNKINFI